MTRRSVPSISPARPCGDWVSERCGCRPPGTPAGQRSREEARGIYRRVYERGVNFIDVANIYGYGECEEILAEALHPYPDDLLIGTKAGFRPGKIEPGQSSLPAEGRPDRIKEECDRSLRG